MYSDSTVSETAVSSRGDLRFLNFEANTRVPWISSFQSAKFLHMYTHVYIIYIYIYIYICTSLALSVFVARLPERLNFLNQ